jgi:hypothetical protein
MTYLADFKTIIHLVLEGTHLNFSDELGLDDRFGHNKWYKLAEMR